MDFLSKPYKQRAHLEFLVASNVSILNEHQQLYQTDCSQNSLPSTYSLN